LMSEKVDDKRAAAAEAAPLMSEKDREKRAAAAEAARYFKQQYEGRLKDEVRDAVKQAKADGAISFEEVMGILKLTSEYLGSDPDDAEIKSLVKQCHRVAPPVLQNSIGMQLKFIQTGERFNMGQNVFGVGLDQTRRNDSRPHEVELVYPFYLGVYQVTNSEWKELMGRLPEHGKHDAWPVEHVSWDDAVMFCQKLSELPAEKKAGRLYRLPSEAEWEFACRAGTNSQFSFGDDVELLNEYAWFKQNSAGRAHSVGRKKPNQFGLYDMHGNVCEWCNDWYADEYPDELVIDPRGPKGGTARVLRGGGWDNIAAWCESAWRNAVEPETRGDALGFRVALGPTEPVFVPEEDNGVLTFTSY